MLSRVLEILGAVKDDKTALSVISDVLKAAVAYVDAVCCLQRHILIMGDADVDAVSSLDQRRTIAHNSLIDNINICNRYLYKVMGDKMPIGGIYAADPAHLTNKRRREIGDWAGTLVDEIFKNRR